MVLLLSNMAFSQKEIQSLVQFLGGAEVDVHLGEPGDDIPACEKLELVIVVDDGGVEGANIILIDLLGESSEAIVDIDAPISCALLVLVDVLLNYAGSFPGNYIFAYWNPVNLLRCGVPTLHFRDKREMCLCQRVEPGLAVSSVV